VEITWKLGITPELVQWFLSFGSHVTVLEPEGLRERLKAEAASVAQKYG
jgi:predicted DNA-binding transcriptional regulator YafY